MSSPEGDKENGPRLDNTRREEVGNHHHHHHDSSLMMKGGDEKPSHVVLEQRERESPRSYSRSPSRRRRDQYQYRQQRRSSSSSSSTSVSRSRSRSRSRRRYEDDRGRDHHHHHRHHRGRSSYDSNDRYEERYEREDYYRRRDDYYNEDRRRMERPRDDRRDHRWEDPRGDRDHSSRSSQHNHRQQQQQQQLRQQKPLPEYRVVQAPKDERLGGVQDDPRGEDPTKRITKKASSRGNGRNTESFDPASTLVRPDLRIQIGSNKSQVFQGPLKHDDVVIIPELFGPQDDWSMYYQLVKEMREVQAKGDVKGSEWISWHEGAHLICKNPTGSPTFTKVIDRLCDYFNIRRESIGTRFNWYRDSSDWKPFHHDSAAFNPTRARNQNITVGISFGATRELAFIRAEPLQNEEKVRIYFPQTNNGVFSFGRDANILWKHGVNALPPSEQDGKGRISIVLWGLAQNVIEEEGSPMLLGSDGQGPHANTTSSRRGTNNRRKSGGGRGGAGRRRGGGGANNNDRGGKGRGGAGGDSRR